MSLGSLWAGWCPIYSPNSLTDVSFCFPDAKFVKSSCRNFLNLKIWGNAARIFRIWDQSHSAPFLGKKSGFRGRWFVAWSYLVVWWVGEMISLCVCSRLSKKTTKPWANFWNLILTPISCMKTKPGKLLSYQSFALASWCIYKTTLLLPTQMAFSLHCGMFAEQGAWSPKTMLTSTPALEGQVLPLVN